MTQHYLPVHKKESRNFSKIWYKKVHATTCISMHRSPKQWWSADKTIFQYFKTIFHYIKENHWSKCTTLNSWDHTSQQTSEDGEIKRRIALALLDKRLLYWPVSGKTGI